MLLRKFKLPVGALTLTNSFNPALAGHLTLSLRSHARFKVCHRLILPAVDNLSAIRQRYNLTLEETIRGVMNVFSELVLLSACDAIVASGSGFSGAAAAWGGVSAANIRVLPRFMSHSGPAGVFCPQSAYTWNYYAHNL